MKRFAYSNEVEDVSRSLNCEAGRSTFHDVLSGKHLRLFSFFQDDVTEMMRYRFIEYQLRSMGGYCKYKKVTNNRTTNTKPPGSLSKEKGEASKN